tara:strand:+ start:36 stop:206 length:171 start_codon:yes stop_codon:yes gene_type:complete
MYKTKIEYKINILFFNQIQLLSLNEITNKPIDDKKSEIFTKAEPITNDIGKIKKIK